MIDICCCVSSIGHSWLIQTRLILWMSTSSKTRRQNLVRMLMLLNYAHRRVWSLMRNLRCSSNRKFFPLWVRDGRCVRLLDLTLRVHLSYYSFLLCFALLHPPVFALHLSHLRFLLFGFCPHPFHLILHLYHVPLGLSSPMALFLGLSLPLLNHWSHLNLIKVFNHL